MRRVLGASWIFASIPQVLKSSVLVKRMCQCAAKPPPVVEARAVLSGEGEDDTKKRSSKLEANIASR